MRTYPQCIPCMSRLLESTIQRIDLPEQNRKDLLKSFINEISNADHSLPPARISGAVYLKLLAVSNQDDLFRPYKDKSIQEALNLYPQLKTLVDLAKDRIEAAIRISALGNILDVANPNSYNLEEEIDRLFHFPIQGNSLEEFKQDLHKEASLLILADNAGETVFDRVLIETLDLPVIYAVKSGPAFDDALFQDAVAAGVDQVAEIITTGSIFPGTDLPSCSPEFRELFNSAPLILAKGQANLETLSDVHREVFFLLKVKCEVISKEINYPLGSLVLRH